MAIATATATAGIIVGTITLTCIGPVLTDLVTALSGGNPARGWIFLPALVLISWVAGRQRRRRDDAKGSP